MTDEFITDLPALTSADLDGTELLPIEDDPSGTPVTSALPVSELADYVGTTHDHDADYEATGTAAAAVTTHEAALDPHTGYRKESDDHTHASSGAQGGTIAHSALTSVTANQHHNEDHASRHAAAGSDPLMDGTAPSTQAFGDAASSGSATVAAKRDHKHAMPANPKLGNAFIPAGAMLPAITSGATGPSQIERSGNGTNLVVLDFPDGSTKYAHFGFDMPSDWDAGTFTAEFEWTNANANTQVVKWQIEAAAVRDDDAVDVAWGTAVTVTDANLNSAYDFMRSAATGAVTAGGTRVAGCRINCRIARLGGDGSDTLTSDARLIGVRIVYSRS